MLQSINLVWFKRDLRITDHKPLSKAILLGKPVVLLYVFEPSLVNDPHYDERHWRFVWESLEDMKSQSPETFILNIVFDEVINVLEKISTKYNIDTIFSHEETGIETTYMRDKSIKTWCVKRKVQWVEIPTNAVYRGLMSRSDWKDRWKKRVFDEIDDPNLNTLNCISLDNIPGDNDQIEWPKSWTHGDTNFQKGGEIEAWNTILSFIDQRSENYNNSISKPNESRVGCSRISPYLAWGNISLKQLHKIYRESYQKSEFKRALKSFESRLNWHCHFIQKFESECRMEFANINNGYDDIRTDIIPEFVDAWKNGKTGYPLVDASMLAVKQTGYLNFRMRSMLVSFLTHHLWQPWQVGSTHLAKNFLDFEPGIHYPQFQMQAGTTGTNTIRIYNPVKQSKDQDPDGIFIKEFVPELRAIPKELIHEPWKLTAIEQEMYDCRIGVDYPEPIVDITKTYKWANSQLWAKKSDPKVKEESKRILKIHIKPGRRFV